MKNISIFILLLVYSGVCNAQCIADAGPDQHKCLNDSINVGYITLGGSPTANYGTPPYIYSWSINPIEFVSGSSWPYLYTSDILDDTTAANPVILYETASDSLMFYLTVTDSFGCTSFDSCIVTYTLFNQHLYNWDFWINQGDSIYLNSTPNVGGGYGTANYDWNPSYGLSDTNLYAGFWAKPEVSTNYTLTVTDSKGCQITGGGPTYYIHVNSVGLEEFNQIPVSLYPNPSSGEVYFEQKQNKPIEKMELYSVTGANLTTQLNPENRIDLSDYEIGTYILKLYFEEGIVIKKIVKE